MKILAIRGCNLASLAGEFEIDLARGPLGGAGVFAIVGNTGAGKTTLLDALCVALFDRTPRLTNHSTVKVGRGVDDRALLGAQDVRTLLRRGTAAGWAEVDFESGDARQYRARWSVRRARGQSDGTLQDEQLSLTSIAGGERLGGTKTETLKAIHARLGLSFDQFRRSALLAQGEFAAFLRADGKDRSELLERMTGTQIYSRLSVAAHVKAALAEQRLRDGRAFALAIAVMDDDAERATAAELEVATSAAYAARRRHAAALDAARWIAEAARRERELAEAELDHAAARAAAVAAEADRAELALRRRAELLRPAWDDAARLARGAAVAAGEAAAAGDAAERASGELAAIGQRRARIAELHAPVRAARIAAGIVERVVDHIVRPERAAPVAPAVAPTIADDAAWIAARGALAPEIAAWPELDARFAQHAALGDAIAALDRALGEHVDTKARVARAHKVTAGEVQAASHKHEDAKRKAQAYAQKRGLTLDAARRLEDEARTRLGEVERLVGIAAAADAAIAARDDLDRQLAELAAAIAGDAAQRTALGEAHRLASALRAEQGQVLDGLRQAAGYEHARAELVTGEPCPLCGATEHPWRDRGALDDVIANAAERLARTLADLDGIAGSTAAIAAREQHHGTDHARLVRQRQAQVASAEAAIAAWRDQLGSLGELMLVDDPAAPAAARLAADRQALARSRLEDARTTRSQTEAATKAAQDAQAEVQLCQAALDQLAVKLAEHDRRLAELDATIGRVRGERASKRDHHAALEAELAAAMARWMAALPDAAGGPRDAASGGGGGAGGDLSQRRAPADRGGASAREDDRAAGAGDELSRRRATANRGGASDGGDVLSQRRATANRGGAAGGGDDQAQRRAAADRGGAAGAGEDRPAGAGDDLALRREALRRRTEAAGGARAAVRPGGAGDGQGERALLPEGPGAGSAVRRGAALDGPGERALLPEGPGAGSAVRRGAAIDGQDALARAPEGPAALDPALALALVAQLQASAPVRDVTGLGAIPSSPLAIVRLAMAAVADAWRARAERIAHADAALSAAATAIEREARDVDRAVAEHTARCGDAERRRDELGREHAAAMARLAAARGAAGFEPDELRRLLSADPSRVDALAERLAALDRAIDRTRAVVAERERQSTEHRAVRPVADPASDPDGDPDSDPAATRSVVRAGTQAGEHAASLTAQDLDRDAGDAGDAGDARSTSASSDRGFGRLAGHPGAGDVRSTSASSDRWFARLAADAGQLDALADAVTAADRRVARLTAALAADADARVRRAAALAEVASDEVGAEVDRILSDVIGSHDGKLFRSFAQSLTLDSLLAVANAHLDELAPRYQLERVPRHDLELQVIDRDLGSEVRSVQSLSGGESFLVSLALALGLSSMSAHDVRVRTLLIDEGFGTLDPATLDSALSVLDALQATGRQVGVISHVPALVERVGAHVRVVQRGGGRSEVIVA